MTEIKTWPGWEYVQKLGAGGFGDVYEIRRVENGKEYKAALKVISIPNDRYEMETEPLYSWSEGEDSSTIDIQSYVREITKEIELMAKLKGLTNIVSYEDHMVIAHEEEIGWDILIRMELLTPLMQYLKTNKLNEDDTIRLGCDICKALEICEQEQIVHRDIKIENIFINKYGDFVLGDFGVARILEKSGMANTRTGTEQYMAPEVYHGFKYDARADIYSLGIVLYKLLNEGRNPFIPLPPQPLMASSKREAHEKRMAGEIIPDPKNGSERLKKVVLKAVSYEQEKRFVTAKQLRSELEICKKYTLDTENQSKPDKKSKSTKQYVIGAILIIVATIIIGGAVIKSTSKEKEKGIPKNTVVSDNTSDKTTENINENTVKQISLNYENISLSANETVELQASIDGNFQEEDIIWKSSDENVAVVVQNEDKQGATVSYVGEGNCYITVSVGNIDASCLAKCESQTTEAGNISNGELSILKNTSVVLVGDEIPLYLRTGNWYLDGDSDNIQWNVKNKEIASITSSGIVKAEAEGLIEVEAAYNGQNAVTQIQAVEKNDTYGLDFSSDVERITLSTTNLDEGISDNIAFTLKGKIPQHWNAYYYLSPDCNVTCEWGELEDNVLNLKVSSGTSEGSGVLTVFITPEDDITNVIGVCKINIKIV